MLRSVAFWTIIATAATAATGPASVVPAGNFQQRLIAAPSGEVVLAMDGHGWRVVGGESGTDHPLPAASAIHEVRTLSRGWVAAATTEGGRGPLVLFESRDGQVTELPAPSLRGVGLQTEPTPMVASGRLSGLLWLAGNRPRGLAVYSADWDGERWSAPVQLAAPGPGTQGALTAAALPDGRWLAAWSAFDGEADAIHWALRDADGWSPPLRLGSQDHVPDITPSLVATADGALLAWSHYDGNDYRLMLSHFREGSWQPAIQLGGRGSLFPSWKIASDSTPLLLFRQAVPGGWAVWQLDAAGHPRQRAWLSAPPEPRPVLSTESSHLVLVFPGGDRASVTWQPVVP